VPKNVEFDDLAPQRVNGRKSRQGGIKTQELATLQKTDALGFAEVVPSPVAPAFARQTPTRTVDENAAHGLGRRAEEMTAILENRPRLQQTEAAFMQERRRLQRASWSLVPHVADGDGTEFRIGES
jgi:hypothetical protein